MSQPYAKIKARNRERELLARLEGDQLELAQARRVVKACEERRALTIQRLAAQGVSLGDIGDVAQLGRSAVKRIVDLQGRLEG